MNAIEESEIADAGLVDPSREETRRTMPTLPPELLLIIFQYCYDIFKDEEKNQSDFSELPWHCISGGLHPVSMRPTPPSDLFERFRSPARFPFALAAVSPFWNDLLMLQPEYWTEFIFFTGPVSSPTLEISQVYKRLKSYPRNVPIDFIVLNENPPENPDRGTDRSVEEQSQMDVIAEMVFNHFSQCRSLSIETCAGASFPDIGEWLYRHTLDWEPKLLSMVLTQRKSEKQSRSKQSVVKTSQDDDWPYFNLNSLVISGSRLDIILRARPGETLYWLEKLVIVDYKYYKFAQGGLLLEDLLSVICHLPNLDLLKLQNVEFGPNPNQPAFSFQCSVSHLHLDTISSPMIAELMRQCLFDCLESVHITKCAYLKAIPDTESLFFDNPQIYDLTTRLRFWCGTTLWLGRYRGSGDNFFNWLGRDILFQSTRHIPCPCLEELYLFQIPDLSLKSLKKLVRNRNQKIQMITKLSIDQCGFGAPLTKEDLDWFVSRSIEFVYIP